MAVNYQDADRLFRKGEFLELLRIAAATPGLNSEVDARVRVIVAHAAALTGNLKGAIDLVSLNTSPQASPNIRARAESILGIVSQRRGDVDSSQRHFHNAIRYANESKDAERIAWTHLHLYRLLVEGHPMDALVAMLSKVRKAVTRVGDPQLSAYLHASVSVLEGQTGRLNEALRHCDIADSLLKVAPNAWLSGSVHLNRACIASLGCHFDLAAECIANARELTAKSGAINIAYSEANLGLVETLRGRFDKAQAAFSRVLASENPVLASEKPAFAFLAALESLARLYLAIGNLEGCEEALSRIEEEAAKH